VRLLSFLINTNIYISLAAVFLTLETQIQLGMKPQLHPYLFIIFFATIFEYNLHRLVTLITNKDVLKAEKHAWLRENLSKFYFLLAVSVIGFLIAVFLAKREVLLALSPFAILTVFYSLPIFKKEKNIFRLREIPALKIFLIAFVWAAATIFLPIMLSEQSYDKLHIALIFAERFLFIFAITIPFDIRDMKDDAESGLKTIPLLIGEKKSIFIANLALSLFLTLCLIHYPVINMTIILPALILSAISTLIFINYKKIKNLPYYHYAVLDGTMLFQGILVCICYYLQAIHL